MSVPQILVALLIGVGWMAVSFWTEPLFPLGSPNWLLLTIVCFSGAVIVIYWRKFRGLLFDHFHPIELTENLSTIKIDPEVEAPPPMVPDWPVGEAMQYVENILYAHKEPNYDIFETGLRMAGEAIVKRIKSGEIQTWGKRIEVIQESFNQKFISNIDQEQFDKDEWVHRKLDTLSANIDWEIKPQTVSKGRDNDHIQFTALQVNEAQIKNIKWGSFVKKSDAWGAIKELEKRITEYESEEWGNPDENKTQIERTKNRIKAIKRDIENM